MGNVLRTAQGEILKHKPIWMMRQAGRHLPEYKDIRSKQDQFLDMCFSPSLAAEITLQPIRRYGFDAAIFFSDILVLPHLLGQKVSFKPGIGPLLEDLDLEKILNTDNQTWQMKAGPIYEALERVCKEKPSDIDLIGFAGGPWTVLTYMLNGQGGSSLEAFAKSFSIGSQIHNLLQLMIDVTSTHLINQVKSGADIVMIFESWAGGLSTSYFEKFIIEPLMRIVENIRKFRKDIPIVIFPRGLGEISLEDLCSAVRPDVVGLDTGFNLKFLDRIHDHVRATQGNLDPIILEVGGQDLEREIDQLLERVQGLPHIVNLGHGVRPTTPIKNVEFILERVRRS